MDYTDRDSQDLLRELVKYAEAFAGDHPGAGLTVLDLADDLVTSADSLNQHAFTQLRDRIRAALIA